MSEKVVYRSWLQNLSSFLQESGQASPLYDISKKESDVKVVHENGIDEKTSDILSDEEDIDHDEVPLQQTLKADEAETELEDGEVEDSDEEEQAPSSPRPPQPVKFEPKQRLVEPVRSSIVYSPTKCMNSCYIWQFISRIWIIFSPWFSSRGGEKCSSCQCRRVRQTGRSWCLQIFPARTMHMGQFLQIFASGF